MMKLQLSFRNETKTCYRFERRDDAGNLITLYLKKSQLAKEGIRPSKGLTVTIEEAHHD